MSEKRSLVVCGERDSGLLGYKDVVTSLLEVQGWFCGSVLFTAFLEAGNDTYLSYKRYIFLISTALEFDSLKRPASYLSGLGKVVEFVSTDEEVLDLVDQSGFLALDQTGFTVRLCFPTSGSVVFTAHR